MLQMRAHKLAQPRTKAQKKPTKQKRQGSQDVQTASTSSPRRAAKKKTENPSKGRCQSEHTTVIVIVKVIVIVIVIVIVVVIEIVQVEPGKPGAEVSKKKNYK